MKRRVLGFCLSLFLLVGFGLQKISFSEENQSGLIQTPSSQEATHSTAEATEEGSGESLTSKQWALKFINFFVFVLLLYFTAGKQLKIFLRNKRQSLETEIKEAEQAQNQARDLLIQFQDKLYQFENTKTELMAKFQKEAQLEKVYLQEMLKEQIARMEHDFELQMQLAVKKNYRDLMNQLIVQSISQATDILQKSIKPGDQEKLLLQTVSELEKFPPPALRSDARVNGSLGGTI